MTKLAALQTMEKLERIVDSKMSTDERDEAINNVLNSLSEEVKADNDIQQILIMHKGKEKLTEFEREVMAEILHTESFSAIGVLLTTVLVNIHKLKEDNKKLISLLNQQML